VSAPSLLAAAGIAPPARPPRLSAAQIDGIRLYWEAQP
jgi:hypothetical protein